MTDPLFLVVFGLSITSSWGNGHATTYRALLREFAARGHRILFLERDQPWYANSRDLLTLPYAQVELYQSLRDVQERFTQAIRAADAVIIGSYVPEGIRVGQWVLEEAGGITAFYDIDTPVTLAKVRREGAEYLTADLIARYDLYLSFTGGPTLDQIEDELGSPMARALYCSVDPAQYHPEPLNRRWDLAFLGTYSPDRQPSLEKLLVEPARRWTSGRFAVAGAQYPGRVEWPANIDRIEHLPPGEHRRFYNEQRFTLNLTRADMIRAGYSPSVRLFEAAACGVPVISDRWKGLEEYFEPGREIITADRPEEVLDCLRVISPAEAEAIGRAARKRVLAHHTAARRAAELEAHLAEAGAVRGRRSRNIVARETASK